ncbi:MAG: tyrosine-type recombinase/integrase [Oscillospiraceae bacterium]|nr:tyrosine-type recombinase/integrase [Oscillospiraceae bacterium]
MRKITLAGNFKQNRTSFEDARTSFIKFCKLKNLAKPSLDYYDGHLKFFHKKVPVMYLDEITQETFDDFIFAQLEEGKRTTTINSQLRGLRVFFKFCAERDYIEELSIKLLKDDAELKEPYTDAELRKLLARPKSNRWAEYRSWAMINYLVATGNRARTIVNIKISDINFDENTIHLRAMKNRHQQFIPLSPALKEVLEEYLSAWKWEFDDYLFPTYTGEQANFDTSCVEVTSTQLASFENISEKSDFPSSCQRAKRQKGRSFYIAETAVEGSALCNYDPS